MNAFHARRRSPAVGRRCRTAPLVFLHPMDRLATRAKVVAALGFTALVFAGARAIDASAPALKRSDRRLLEQRFAELCPTFR